MKDKIVIDLGRIMDEIFDATRGFGDMFHDGLKQGKEEAEKVFKWNEEVDYYPAYSYPPMNVYIDEDKSLIFEFAIAGFDEKLVNLEFRGDYMIFSAAAPDLRPKGDVKFFKRRLKFKDIKEQKYYVPEDKFLRDKVKAVFKNGVLRMSIPPTDIIETKEGIRVEIVKEDE